VYSYPLDICIDIMLGIAKLSTKTFSHFSSTGGIDEVQESSGTTHMSCFNGDPQSFAKIEISVSEIDLEFITIEIFAELSFDEFSKLNLENFQVGQTIKKYESLVPVITEGIIHQLSNLKSSETMAQRTLTVRFQTYNESIDKDEEGGYNFDTADIAEKTIPYLKALLEIYNELLNRK
jgi:hypothetical protein